MKVHVWSRVLGMSLLLAAVGACSSGPPKIADLKVGSDKEATKTTAAFGAKDTVYAVANIDNPPSKGKIVARLAIVDVPGQQKGPIPGLESSLALAGGMNKANFDFTPPTAGWPDGKYQLQVVLYDDSGAQKDQKSADFSTSGNAAAAPAATDTTATATDTAASDTTSTTSTQ